MSETKPQKRLVSKEEYRQIRRRVTGLHFSSALLLLIGAGGMLIIGIGWYYLFSAALHPSIRDIIRYIIPMTFAFAMLSILFLLFGKCINSKAVQVATSITPITDHNAHLLPAQETLLRGSDLPPTVQQAELLRATQAGQETPHEQLLRATAGEE